jgi:predicted ATPase/class 3 adenylate cyclase
MVLQARMSHTVAAIVGDELQRRLANSEPRPLALLYDGEAPIDLVDWESLELGSTRLAQKFALGRQLASGDANAPALPAAGQATQLTALRLRASNGAVSPDGIPQIELASLDRAAARALVADADVLFLDGVGLSEWQQLVHAPTRHCLLVVRDNPSVAQLAAALDAGAAVLCLGADEGTDPALATLLRQLISTGESIGEILRGLRRRAAPDPFAARLYGDPELRLVRPALPTTRRQVTSLSFDLVGSTDLLQRLGDEAYAETLTALHLGCADIVRRHGGQPDEPQGDDGVMGYFGHPSALENAAVRAVEAGLAIVRAASALGLRVRVGVATGPVAVKAGQPVGLSIHLAARLQQAAQAGTVLVSEPTRSLVLPAFALQLRADLPALKGVSVQAAYVVLGPHGTAGERRDEGRPSLQPMVGREAELERLRRHWRQTQADDTGRARLVVVGAEAGMGKSRLVREFRRQLGHTGARVLEVRCRLDASASPFLALAEALRRWLDIGPNEAFERARDKLAAVLPVHARQGAALALLADLLGIVPPQSVPACGSRSRVLGLLVDWLRHLTAGQPSCLIVEDWHWVDPSTREFVEHLLRASAGLRLLMLITTRGNDALGSTNAAGQAAAVHEHIELAGLSPTASRELVEYMCAERPISPQFIMQLAKRGDGVPLFLEEAARLALELGSKAAGSEPRALDAVPASLQDLLMARLDALGPAKPVAQVAAVLGRSFSRGLLAALLDTTTHALDPATLDERLDLLCASGVVRAEVDGGLVFRHALIRDAAYSSLWARERQALHTRVVELLQRRWPELAAQQPELLAQHQTEAGLHQEALTQWERAASRAASRSAEVEAVSHLRRALSVLACTPASEERDRRALRLQLLLAARLLATEGYGAEAVHEAYLEARNLCDGIEDQTALFKVEMGLEAYRFMRAEFAPALEHGLRAAEMARLSGDLKQRLHAHWGLACTLFHQGELRATMREMETALALYSPALHTQFGIQDPGVMCMAYSSWCLWELGRPDAALARINKAVQMAGEFEHRFSQAVALAYAVSIELLRGEADAALQRAGLCAQVCEEFGFPVWLAITRCMRGHLLCTRGDFDEGLREMRAGHAQWLRTGARVSQPLYLSLQAEGLMCAGRLEEAAAAVDEGLTIVERYGERQLDAELCRLRGELALQQGDATAGEAWLRRAYVLALRRHRIGFALRSATALARHWAGGGQHDRARRLLAPLLARWTEGHDTRDVRLATALVGSLH